MRLLLDGHALLWATGDSSKLRETARTAINDPDNDVLVSIATLWEIGFVDDEYRSLLFAQHDPVVKCQHGNDNYF